MKGETKLVLSLMVDILVKCTLGFLWVKMFTTDNYIIFFCITLIAIYYCLFFICKIDEIKNSKSD